MTTLFIVLLSLTGCGWLALEIVLVLRERARDRGSTAADRGTRALNFAMMVAAVAAAVVLWGITAGDAHSPVRIPGGWPEVAGLVIAWIGLALRIWAIAVLGRSFRTTVEVDTGQAVVARGPYRWVRHPSYTGLLLIAAGLGLAYGTWPGLVLCLVLPELALLRRISVEEAALTRVMGEPYRAYQGRTKRLIPGLW